MNKYEFLTQLDQYLNGNVSEQERTESVQYYREYIDSQMAAGKSEEEVLEELGSPNSIGKSIVEARGTDSYSEYDDSDDSGYSGYGHGEAGEPATRGSFKQIHFEGWKSWLVIGAIILVIILVMSLVFRIFAALLPFLIPFLIILFVIKLFSDRR